MLNLFDKIILNFESTKLIQNNLLINNFFIKQQNLQSKNYTFDSNSSILLVKLLFNFVNSLIDSTKGAIKLS
jgi:hypothetical protein